MENKNTNNKSSGALSTFKRIAKYSGLRLISLFITVIIGAYLTIMIASMGGHVDEIIKSQVDERLAMQIANDPSYQKMSVQKRRVYMNNKKELEYKRLGLDQPFILKSFKFLFNAMTLNLGTSDYIKSDTGSKQVSTIIAERLGPSLMLMGTANMLLFIIAILVALGLSRKYGSKIDKLFISLSPLSSMPAWFYGIFFILLFAAVFKILPFGGMIDSPPPQAFLPRTLSILKHLTLPVLSLVISASFASIYSWRTFFMIYSSEDYVEMAKAKGLPRKLIKRRYILRPTLPTIITSFTLMMITMWMGAMVTETIFQWPGLGTVVLSATKFYDTAIIVGVNIIYGYLLAITVFLLDFVYALVDPRVKIGQGNRG